MYKTSFIFLSAVLLTLHAWSAQDTTQHKPKQFMPESQHALTYQTALQFVASYHFSKPAINDAFSEKAFKNYLDMLDPQKLYFTQVDIDNFNQYSLRIDDAMLDGNIQFLFDIFNTSQQRMFDRIDYATTLLRDSFDFTLQDSFEINREDAAYCTDFADMDALWYARIKYECLQLASSGKYYKEYSETIRKRYENLAKNALKTKSEDVFQLIMNAILEVCDPHTNYFSPRTAEDFNQSMSLSLEGIGAQLQMEGEYTKIREVIKGGPADRSKKLKAGDKIIGVGQAEKGEIVNVIDWRLDDVVSLIRGKKGTTVRLEIIPANDPNKVKIIELVRDKIVLEDQSAKSSVKEVVRNGKKMKVGVVSIPAFYMDFAAAQRGDKEYKSTTRDVKKLITELNKQKIQGLIIDLRNNGGGSLQEAVELTGLFINSGPVVQVKDMMGNTRVEQDKDGGLVYYDGPLVVLVNRFSASASEIFAGAIQDYNRGIVVGERTFGKGTVQQVEDMNNYVRLGNAKVGQVKLTLAKFYRVNGSSTQHKGVTPDILLPSIYDGRKYGEDGSEFALPWDQIATSYYTSLSQEMLKRDMLQQLHSTRITKNIEYTYLKQDIERIQQLEKRRYITLNQAQMKAQTTEDDNVKKQRDEFRKANKSDNADAQDLILTEGEEVILDLLQLK
ncbi:MAG: carboxy terminal-processing peptidase [Bacteroidota bacterium]|jgi:carboxyl-terminal processing protease